MHSFWNSNMCGWYVYYLDIRITNGSSISVFLQHILFPAHKHTVASIYIFLLPGMKLTLCMLSQGRVALSRAPLQELYDPSMETSAANLDDLQRSWETLKNVVRYIIR